MTSIRGSAAGCLVSYLIGLSKIDPIQHKLSFERFLNKGRFSKEKVSPPDIDCDVPADNREEVIEYIKEKYGYANVGQILTYQTIKGSAALKAVFRAHNALPFNEVNVMTKSLPEESKISDKLQDLPPEDRSVIKYALNTYPEKFNQWCHINEHGELDGEYQNLFKQALRLEKIKSAMSKHAAGIIISPYNLTESCPTIYDTTSDKLLCAMEMNDLEAIGCLKLDILGLRLFSRIVDITNDLRLEYV